MPKLCISALGGFVPAFGVPLPGHKQKECVEPHPGRQRKGHSLPREASHRSADFAVASTSSYSWCRTSRREKCRVWFRNVSPSCSLSFRGAAAGPAPLARCPNLEYKTPSVLGRKRDFLPWPRPLQDRGSSCSWQYAAMLSFFSAEPGQAEPKGLELDRADIDAARTSGKGRMAGRRISSDSWALAAPQAGGSFASPVRGHGPRKPLLLSAPLGSEPELILTRCFWGQSTRARHTGTAHHRTAPQPVATATIRRCKEQRPKLPPSIWS